MSDEMTTLEAELHSDVSFAMSQEIDQIAPAMAKAYGAMAQAAKDARNTFFNSSYADLSSVDEAIRPSLAKNDLFVMQTVRRTEELGMVVTTRVMHKSGQWIDTNVIYVEPQPYEDPEKGTIFPTSQNHGSATTYARRYGLMAAVGLAVTDKTDDDGNSAATHQQNSSSSRPPQQRSSGGGGGGQSFDGPKRMQAKFKGKVPCPVCGEIPNKGEEIAYEKGNVRHWSCYEAQQSGAEPQAEPASTKKNDDDDLPF